MNRRNLFTAICVITLGIAAIAMSQTYFEDNFDDPKESEKNGSPSLEIGNSRLTNTINSKIHPTA